MTVSHEGGRPGLRSLHLLRFAVLCGVFGLLISVPATDGEVAWVLVFYFLTGLLVGSLDWLKSRSRG